MEFSEIIARQVSADHRRGFLLHAKKDKQQLELIERDLIGLVGEVGELANRLKKIRLQQDHPAYLGPTLEGDSATLREELADIAIYVIRLSTMLKGDLEGDVLRKMGINDQRYADLE